MKFHLVFIVHAKNFTIKKDIMSISIVKILDFTDEIERILIFVSKIKGDIGILGTKLLWILRADTDSTVKKQIFTIFRTEY